LGFLFFFFCLPTTHQPFCFHASQTPHLHIINLRPAPHGIAFTDLSEPPISYNICFCGWPGYNLLELIYPDHPCPGAISCSSIQPLDYHFRTSPPALCITTAIRKRAAPWLDHLEHHHTPQYAFLILLRPLNLSQWPTSQALPYCSENVPIARSSATLILNLAFWPLPRIIPLVYDLHYLIPRNPQT
jgi:hypothetical protein